MTDTTTQSGQRPPNANRLTPAEWAEAVERARAGHEAFTREKTMIGVVLAADAVSYALRAAFPHLAPDA